MKKVEIISHFIEYDDVKELSEEDQNLVLAARQSVSKAYALYSRFQVGAAVSLANGVIMRGNNQENASYPIGLCAERVAIFAAGANYPGVKIRAIAVTALSDQFLIDKPITPCGACRQAIAEYEHRYHGQIRLILVGETGKVLVADTIKQFLPYQFTAEDLKVKTS